MTMKARTTPKNTPIAIFEVEVGILPHNLPFLNALVFDVQVYSGVFR
jgi:hypothetical protein